MNQREIRRRKQLKDDTSPSYGIKKRTLNQPRGLRKIFILLIIIALCVMYLSGLFTTQPQWFDSIAKSLGYQSTYHYAVIIDAGSSGTRVLAYKFRVPFTMFGATRLELEQEYFEQSKPGLSSFADDPEKGANTVVQLIKNAEFLTPPEKRNSTPILVKATAGLRLLPEEKSNMLLTHVESAISKLGYDVAPQSVEIMKGSDEGIFIWYTVNLLSELISTEETMAALDLGGGSTQITYQLKPEEVARVKPNEVYILEAGQNVTLYTHSYLNLGLLAARYGIFASEASDNTSNKFTSVCVDPIVQDEPWVYANKKYLVSGAPREAKAKKQTVYERCHKVVKNYVMSTLDYHPESPPKGTVAAMSFFYDVAADAGIIDVMKGGTVDVRQYKSAALIACSASNVDQPWACVDLVYIIALLQDAYKMKDSTNISLFKKVRNHEVSWALGLAYTTVMQRITHEKNPPKST